MKKGTKRVIVAVVVIQVLLILGLSVLPNIVKSIPGRYRVALSERSPFLSQLAEGLIEQVAPVADVLPAPVAAANHTQISIPTRNPPTVTSPSLSPTVATTVTQESEASIASDSQASDEEEAINVSPTVKPTSTPLPTMTPTPEPLPIQASLEGIPRIQQSFNNCGPANLTQVLNWYGDETTQAQAASYLKPNAEDRNVSPWQLSDYVNDFTGLKSTVHSGGDLELIKRLIAAGYPVVIEKGYEPDTSGASGWFGHYLTVFGYDDAERVFYSMDTYLKVDPTTGRADPYDVFESYWQNFNYTFYVVYEQEQEQEVFSIIGPELLDPFTMWENAAVRAQTELDEDPDNAFSWFNLGTSLTRLGELTGEAEYYQNGAAAFDQARTIGLPPRMLWYEFRPYLAYMKVGRYDDMLELADAVLEAQGGQNVEETYLYKGHAQLFQGDVRGATESYERALQLNENFYPAEIALQSLN